MRGPQVFARPTRWHDGSKELRVGGACSPAKREDNIFGVASGVRFPRGAMLRTEMPYRILCNGTSQKNQEARSDLGLTPSRCASLPNIRYGIPKIAWESTLRRRIMVL